MLTIEIYFPIKVWDCIDFLWSSSLKKGKKKKRKKVSVIFEWIQMALFDNDIHFTLRWLRQKSDVLAEFIAMYW